MRIESVTNIETNEYYDAKKCHDGGGYSQPTIRVAFDDGTTLVIVDTSCGDFGSRIYAGYYQPDSDATEAECEYGSMLEHEHEYSSFSRQKHGEMLNLVYEATGYGLLTVERLLEEAEL